MKPLHVDEKKQTQTVSLKRFNHNWILYTAPLTLIVVLVAIVIVLNMHKPSGLVDVNNMKSSALEEVKPRSVDVPEFFPSLSLNNEPVPTYAVIQLNQAVKGKNPVLSGFRLPHAQNEAQILAHDFLVALYADDQVKMSEIEALLRQRELEPGFEQARVNLATDIVRFYQSNVTPKRVVQIGNAVEALYLLHMPEMGDQLLQSVLAELNEQAFLRSSNPSNSGGNGNVPSEELIFDEPSQNQDAHQDNPVLPPIDVNMSIGTGVSVIPLLWEFERLVTYFQNNTYLSHHDTTYYVVSVGQGNYVDRFGLSAYFGSNQKLNYTLVYLANRPDTVVLRDYNPDEEELYFLGQPRAYWHGHYTENGINHYWWALMSLGWVGSDSPFEVGDVVNVSSTGPISIVSSTN